jgi:hypothetical protein
VPSEHDVRQRAVICQDCWFWKEMSCALASPVDGVCANKRPVQGRRATPQPAQAALVPLAAGHAMDVAAHAVAPVHAPVHPPVQPAPAPFATDAPEATFTIAQLRAPESSAVAPQEVESTAVRPIRTTPPSFREIRAGRAAAASRAPIAEVRIPLGELENGTLLSDAASQDSVPSAMLPCMDSLVERVRQRTAARLNRSSAFIPA